LIYNWSVVGIPPAPVSFLLNNSNAAVNTTANFTTAVSYTLQVSVNDPSSNLSQPGTVPVTATPVASTIMVTTGDDPPSQRH
jgi:hypothetical protein